MDVYVPAYNSGLSGACSYDVVMASTLENVNFHLTRCTISSRKSSMAKKWKMEDGYVPLSQQYLE